MNIDIYVRNEKEALVDVTDTQETEGVFIEIDNKETGEYFEIWKGEVTSCMTEDIDLNSDPDLVKVYNYILESYDVDIDKIVANVLIKEEGV